MTAVSFLLGKSASDDSFLFAFMLIFVEQFFGPVLDNAGFVDGESKEMVRF